MKIEIDDATLGDFIPFAVLVFQPPDGLMIHLIAQITNSGRSIPAPLAEQLLGAILKPGLGLTLLRVDGPPGRQN
jgi:hypothetical protein